MASQYTGPDYPPNAYQQQRMGPHLHYRNSVPQNPYFPPSEISPTNPGPSQQRYPDTSPYHPQLQPNHPEFVSSGNHLNVHNHPVLHPPATGLQSHDNAQPVSRSQTLSTGGTSSVYSSDDESQRRNLSKTESADSSMDSERGFSRSGRNRASSASSSDDSEDDDVHQQHVKKREKLKSMSYHARRKHLRKARIEFHVVSVPERHEFLLKLARALLTFGAPSHRIESQLVSAARILDVQAEFIHIPGVIICSFGDREKDAGTSESHFVKCGGRLALGCLHKMHIIYRAVVHDEITATRAKEKLEALLDAPPLYGPKLRCIMAFLLSIFICPLSFGGSFVDLWIAGLGALFLATAQQMVASKNGIYANVFEITMAIVISFAARGLASIPGHYFCYTAISAAGIVGILPGYLILTSSLELASKNIVCGSVKMVYALIYTLFLGFGLQIGSDFFLLLDKNARERLDAIESVLRQDVSISGAWIADNTNMNETSGVPLIGTWTFTKSMPPEMRDIVNGCYRPPSFPWYLQPFPYWCAYFIVPAFSTISSLLNQQPLWSRQLPVMVIISCASYTTNKIANHYIFNRSDVVSAIGAFTVGVLGNIYSRKMGGTAFTSMVTGVLFLVPSGLSQAGGITARGNGIDIGGAMIATAIGITVGLFMSQAIVYMFGTRKNAAVFSF